MNDQEKLKKLLLHWKEHNDEHAEVYREWAGKAESSGEKELSIALRKLAEETKKLDGLFEEALKKI